ncbi:unnamed protein product [Schistosoma haematobium]|nr:unnamed protein product [Schistosoma haematobium]
MKLLHGDANIPDIKSIFGSDVSGCINMNVMPGSKSANLVPYAVEKFQSGETETEEPGIAILFSKSQFPGEDCQLPVDFGGNSFSDFINKGDTSKSNLDHPPSRRRLSRTIRKKRDTVRDSNKNEAKFVNNGSSEMGDFHNVSFQTPRLAAAISNVNKVLKHKKLNRKRKKSNS